MISGQSLGWRLFLVADAGDGKWAPGVEGAGAKPPELLKVEVFFRENLP